MTSIQPAIPVRCFVASAVIVADTDPPQTLLLKRACDYLKGHWTYVAGSIKSGERASQAILREICEETGLRVLRLYTTDFCEQFYHQDLDCISVVPAFVAWVDPGEQVKLNYEHSSFRWVDFETAQRKVPFGGQRDLYCRVYREFVLRSPPEVFRITF